MQPYKTVAYETLGCKLNFSETSAIAKDLEEAGYARVAFDLSPDVVVINTCSVTDNADKKCRNIVRRAMRNNPKAFVVVIGCYAQLKPEEIKEIDGVDLVLGANEKFNLLKYIEQTDKLAEPEAIYGHIKEVRHFQPGFSSGDRTRTFLKIQDGCDYFCSFCTIPLARGRSRSANISETVLKATEAAKTGVKEVVITGVNTGDFGREHSQSFYELIQELDQIQGVERFRISSIEPNLLTDQIIEFVAQSKKFVPHFHIPLQSGNDEILANMRRRYRTQLYRERVEKIKKLMPNACIGVDIIIGFPGESDEHFQDTFDFLHGLDISYLHVFTYSERPNTTAVRMTDQVVPHQQRNERSKRLRILSEKKKRAFYRSQVGRIESVLFEKEQSDSLMHGFTSNYVKVSVPFDAALANQIHPVSLSEVGPDGNMRINILETAHV